MVRLTRIYTKTGDAGQTHLGDISRVEKTDPGWSPTPTSTRPTACSASPWRSGAPEPDGRRAAAQHPERPVRRRRRPVHPGRRADPEFPPLRITAAYTERLEAACDEYNERLPKLTSFILPGGTAAAALLHQARVVARRAERSVWALLAADAERTNAETARYLNRLSDLLFILARAANPGGDILWEPGAHSGAHARRGRDWARLQARRGRLHPGEEAGHRRAVHGQLPRSLRRGDGQDDEVRRAARGRRGRGSAGPPPGAPRD